MATTVAHDEGTAWVRQLIRHLLNVGVQKIGKEAYGGLLDVVDVVGWQVFISKLFVFLCAEKHCIFYSGNFKGLLAK